MVIDLRQKRFVMNLQLRQCLARAKPFRLKKIKKKPDFDWCFLFSRKAKCVTKSLNFKTWLQKCQTGNPASDQRRHETTIVSELLRHKAKYWTTVT